MNTSAIKQQLHNYLDVADSKKLKAIYTMVEEDIMVSSTDYSSAFKAELDNRVNRYLNGDKMVTPDQMHKKLKAVRNKRK
ncbi:MAG: hypothetical protein V4539_04190 [Bacteroidota bacterium]